MFTTALALSSFGWGKTVTLYKYGEWEGHFYLVSELIQGKSLDRLHSPLDWWEVLVIGVDAAHGLAAAHSNNVLHRDIKPANLMLTETGKVKVKLLDFGLAKKVSPLAARVSRSSPPRPDNEDLLVGTPLYMARELWQKEAPTRRSDVYALGAVLYQLISGRPPYPASSMKELIEAVQRQPVEPLRERVPGVPPSLAALIDRCLHVDPQQRPADGGELALLLEQARQTQFGPNPPLRWTALAAVLAVVALCGVALGLFLWPSRADHARLIRLDGGRATLGSTGDETQALQARCQSETPGHCEPGLYTVENPDHSVLLSPFEIADREQSMDGFAAWLNKELHRGRTRVGLRRTEHDDSVDTYLYVGELPVVNLYPSSKLHSGFPLYLATSEERIAVKQGGERLPVNQVTWYGAQLYCQDRGLRLPTEAEWEFAARGARQRRFPWGDEELECEQVQWDRAVARSFSGCYKDPVLFGRRFLTLMQLREIHGSSAGLDAEFAVGYKLCALPAIEGRGLPCSGLGYRLVPVDTRNSDVTEDGVRHLAGNASEWVLDAFAPYPACREPPCVDPVVLGSVRQADAPRVFRGGDVGTRPQMARGAARQSYRPDSGPLRVGFRCAAQVDRARDPLLHLLDPSVPLRNSVPE